MTEALTIGEIAARAGVTRDTIRYYKRSGLLESPAHSRGRHRVYDGDTIERIGLIRRLQSCGLTTRDIREVLRVSRKEGTESTQAVREILEARQKFIAERLSHLRASASRVKRAISLCHDDETNPREALKRLPDVPLNSPFRFGRRARAKKPG